MSLASTTILVIRSCIKKPPSLLLLLHVVAIYPDEVQDDAHPPHVYILVLLNWFAAGCPFIV